MILIVHIFFTLFFGWRKCNTQEMRVSETIAELRLKTKDPAYCEPLYKDYAKHVSASEITNSPGENSRILCPAYPHLCTEILRYEEDAQFCRPECSSMALSHFCSGL